MSEQRAPYIYTVVDVNAGNMQLDPRYGKEPILHGGSITADPSDVVEFLAQNDVVRHAFIEWLAAKIPPLDTNAEL